MARIIFCLFMCVFFAFSSCRIVAVDDCSTYDYSDCNNREPDSGYVSLSFTVSKNHPEVFIELFIDRTEEGKMIHSGKYGEGYTEFLLPVGHEYSAKAWYFIGNDTIVAIDGCKLKSWYYYACDSVCWTTNSPSMNLKIK